MSQIDAIDDDLRRAIAMASRWYIRLQGSAEPALSVALAQWLDISPLHRRAWHEVEQAMAPVSRLPAPLAGSALRDAGVSRRRLLRRLMVVGAVAPLPWLLWRHNALPAWGADFHTAIGERRSEPLPDGSLLALDTGSAVDVRFTATARDLLLRRGQVLIKTARDLSAVPPPFTITTDHGTVTTRGSRFVVRAEPHGSRVSVLDHAVAVMPRVGGAQIVVNAGDSLVFDARHCGAPVKTDPSAASWIAGSVVAVDMPLGRLVEELGRYRHGVLACDPAIAALKVSGAFPIDDTDRALQVLAQAFPVRLHHLTRFWVRIIPA